MDKKNNKKFFDPDNKYKSDMADSYVFNAKYPNTSVNNIYTYNKHKKQRRYGKDCVNFNKEKLTCKLFKQLCNNADKCSSFKFNDEINLHIARTDKFKKIDITDVGITAIVLCDNRKCTQEDHIIKDVQAKLRLSLNPSGEVITYEIPSAYCEQCDLYFILKNDFKKAKEKGIILCPVIDRTAKYMAKNINRNQTGGESKIHQLGYNVIKNNGYTNEQRHVVLANMIENTDISKHEIKTIISRCILQHQNQKNYADSVECWKKDLDFVNNYKLGDMKKVIIEKIIIGRR